VLSEFGRDLVTSEGQIDRKHLAKRAFGQQACTVFGFFFWSCNRCFDYVDNILTYNLVCV